MTDKRGASHSRAIGVVCAENLPSAQTEPEVRPRAPVQVSFAHVYEQHFDFVWRNVRRLGVPDAAVDDLVQEVFIVVHRKLASFEGRSSITTWLYSIVARVVSTYRRAAPQRRHGGELPEDLVSSNTNPHESAARLEAVALLHSFLETLDPERRDVFVLMELEAMSAPDVSVALGIPANTVYSRLRLAREAFEQVVERHHARDNWRQR